MKPGALALAAALMLLVGCRTVPPAPLALESSDPRPRMLLADWSARAELVHSLRGTARVSLDGARGASFARQLLVMERPARLRVEVLGLMNQRVAVLATDGERYDLYRSENGRVESGEIRPSVLWEVAGVPLTPEEAVRVLLGTPPLDLMGQQVAAAVEGADASLHFELRGSEPYWRALEFDAAGLLARYAVRGPEGTLFDVIYEDYRDVAGTRFAHRIQLDFPVSEARAEVSFRGVELNPSFSEGIFRLELPERGASPPGESPG